MAAGLPIVNPFYVLSTPLPCARYRFGKMSDATANSQRSLIGAIDLGTSGIRFYIFASDTLEVVTHHYLQTTTSFPHPGWVEQDPLEILHKSQECISRACENLQQLGFSINQIKCVGVTNQRESLAVWSKDTGEPLCNLIVWSDNRTRQVVADILKTLPGERDDLIRRKTGLQLSTYFTGPKFLWLYQNNEAVRRAVDLKQCMIGNVDAWIVYKLTGEHVTDVTNASRTMFMNISTMAYDESLLHIFRVPREILPSIKSSSEIYGYINSEPLQGVPLSGILGDQQAALVGHLAFRPGHCKATYGTGCFVVCNIGTKPIFSNEGLLTTVAYQFGPKGIPTYAFEGSVAVAGAGIKWLKDNLHLVNDVVELNKMASEVTESDCAFVPAFSGLYCPYWEPKALGIISGLSYSITDKDLARAALEAVCFHVAEITELISKEGGFPVDPLFVDGGMSASNLLLQIQSDITGKTIVRPSMSEVTVLGAVFAAGLADGINLFRFENGKIVNLPTSVNDSFKPKSNTEFQMKRQRHWKSAIRKCLLDSGDAGPGNAGHDTTHFYPLEIFCMASLCILVLSEITTA